MSISIRCGRAAFAICLATAIFCCESGAHAETAPPARVLWGLQAEASVGGGSTSFAQGGAARVGIDGQYWGSKNFGIGGQLALEGVRSIGNFGFDPADNTVSGNANRFSFAPAVTLRGSHPTSFPILSLALGYAWGHSEAGRYCASYIPLDTPGRCQEANWEGDDGGLFGSLLVAWLFHPGGGAFTMGPLLRMDVFAIATPSFMESKYLLDHTGYTITSGVTIGFDLVDMAR